MDVRQLFEDLDWQDWEFWRAFDQVEPIGQPHADERAALIGAAICNAFGAKVTPEKLNPWKHRVQTVVQSDADQINQVIAIIDRHNGAQSWQPRS